MLVLCALEAVQTDQHTGGVGGGRLPFVCIYHRSLTYQYGEIQYIRKHVYAGLYICYFSVFFKQFNIITFPACPTNSTNPKCVSVEFPLLCRVRGMVLLAFTQRRIQDYHYNERGWGRIECLLDIYVR